MTGSSATTAKAIRLRRLLDGPELVRAVGAHNGLTALLAARAGFEAIWASGFEISASHALPDASLLSMTQLLDAGKRWTWPARCLSSQTATRGSAAPATSSIRSSATSDEGSPES